MKREKTVFLQTAVDEIGAPEKAGLPVEMHVFPHDPHGMGLALHDPALRTWPTLLEDWLVRHGLLAETLAAK